MSSRRNYLQSLACTVITPTTKFIIIITIIMRQSINQTITTAAAAAASTCTAVVLLLLYSSSVVIANGQAAAIGAAPRPAAGDHLPRVVGDGSPPVLRKGKPTADLKVSEPALEDRSWLRAREAKGTDCCCCVSVYTGQTYIRRNPHSFIRGTIVTLLCVLIYLKTMCRVAVSMCDYSTRRQQNKTKNRPNISNSNERTIESFMY